MVQLGVALRRIAAIDTREAALRDAMAAACVVVAERPASPEVDDDDEGEAEGEEEGDAHEE